MLLWARGILLRPLLGTLLSLLWDWPGPKLLTGKFYCYLVYLHARRIVDNASVAETIRIRILNFSVEVSLVPETEARIAG
jgi:hypothetical protein